MTDSRQSLEKKAAYRPDIQGLRAVAALLVGTYHIWFGRVSGGVDVFFAVSAFLITTSLLRQLDTKGRVDFVAFWGGLARRLLPAAMLVLFTVAVASMIWLPRTLWDKTIQQTLASIFYVENWQLARRRGGLSRARACGKPRAALLGAVHTGADLLLVGPIVFALSIAAAARLRVRARTIVAGAFAGIFVVSFALSIVETQSNQTFAYFNTFARLWEFCLGAWLAIQPRVTLNKQLRVAFGWIGLVRHRRLRSDLSGIAGVPRIRGVVARRLRGADRHGRAQRQPLRRGPASGVAAAGLHRRHLVRIVLVALAGLGVLSMVHRFRGRRAGRWTRGSDGVDGARRDQHAVRRESAPILRCHLATPRRLAAFVAAGVIPGAARERGLGRLLRSTRSSTTSGRSQWRIRTIQARSRSRTVFSTRASRTFRSIRACSPCSTIWPPFTRTDAIGRTMPTGSATTLHLR